MLLSHKRYSKVLCDNLTTEVLLYNPFLISHVIRAEKFLTDFPSGEKDLARSFERLNSLPPVKDVPVKESDWKEYLSRISLTSSPRGKFLLYTELFSPIWNRAIGSARHIQIGELQLKGAGLTLPADQKDFTDPPGEFSLYAAIKSFIFSHLLNTSLPLGSSRAISVQRVPDHQTTSPRALYVRHLDSLRLAQVSDDLSPEEKELIVRFLHKKFGSEDPRMVARGFCFQFAAAVSLGVNAGISSDNLLISGEFIDEEIWLWPVDLNQAELYYAFNGSENIFATLSSMSQSIQLLRKFLLLVFSPEIIPSLETMTEDFLSSLAGFWRSIPVHEIWKKELAGCTEDFFREMAASGWKIERETIDSQHDRVSLRKPTERTIDDLSGRFNSIARKSVLSVIRKLSYFPSSEGEADRLSTEVQMFVGRSGFVLPDRWTAMGVRRNQMTVAEFHRSMLDRWPGLQKASHFDLVAYDGKEEIVFNSFSAKTKVSAPVIPLFYRVFGMGELEHALACFKTIILNTDEGPLP